MALTFCGLADLGRPDPFSLSPEYCALTIVERDRRQMRAVSTGQAFKKGEARPPARYSTCRTSKGRYAR